MVTLLAVVMARRPECGTNGALLHEFRAFRLAGLGHAHSHVPVNVGVLCGLAALLGIAAVAETVPFDDTPPGELPSGWMPARTGEGEPRWAVVADATAPSPPHTLKQSGVARFALCLKTNATLRDGWAEVKFKPLAGKEDQTGGLVWRARDADNYYVCRANALENNVVLYKTVAGKRTALDIVGRKGGYGVNTPVASGQWHTLRVDFHGNRFAVTFNGRQLFEVEDATFAEAGWVGLWTKADSVTLFDDFRVQAR